jgi:hypothetical protein
MVVQKSTWPESVAADFGPVFGGALYVNGCALREAAQGGDVQALQNHVEGGGGGGHQFGDREAYAVYRYAGPDGQILAKAGREGEGEAAHAVQVVEGLDSGGGLDDACKHGVAARGGQK